MITDWANEIKEQMVILFDKHFPIHSIGECMVNYEAFKYMRFCAVYMLCKKGKIIYIGVSCNTGERLCTHLGRCDFNEVDSIKIIRSDSFDFCVNLEAHLIMTLRPKFNRSTPHCLPNTKSLTQKEYEDTGKLFRQIGSQLKDLVA